MTASLKEKVIEVLKTCFDPELHANIYELGLIYDIHTNEKGFVQIQMTLTSPNCPVAETLPRTVQEKISKIPEVDFCKVGLVWDPPWTKDRMTEAAKLKCNLL